MELSIKRSKLFRKLALIYLLNIVDWACTVILLNTGRYFEANPLMRQFIGSLPGGFFTKCLLPAFAVSAVIFALRMLDRRDLFVADQFISFVLVFYTAVNLDHVINFLLLLHITR